MAMKPEEKVKYDAIFNKFKMTTTQLKSLLEFIEKNGATKSLFSVFSSKKENPKCIFCEGTDGVNSYAPEFFAKVYTLYSGVESFKEKGLKQHEKTVHQCNMCQEKACGHGMSVSDPNSFFSALLMLSLFENSGETVRAQKVKSVVLSRREDVNRILKSWNTIPTSNDVVFHIVKPVSQALEAAVGALSSAEEIKKSSQPPNPQLSRLLTKTKSQTDFTEYDKVCDKLEEDAAVNIAIQKSLLSEQFEKLEKRSESAGIFGSIANGCINPSHDWEQDER